MLCTSFAVASRRLRMAGLNRRLRLMFIAALRSREINSFSPGFQRRPRRAKSPTAAPDCNLLQNRIVLVIHLGAPELCRHLCADPGYAFFIRPARWYGELTPSSGCELGRPVSNHDVAIWDGLPEHSTGRRWPLVKYCMCIVSNALMSSCNYKKGCRHPYTEATFLIIFGEFVASTYHFASSYTEDGSPMMDG